jgi:hypothetical protein
MLNGVMRLRPGRCLLHPAQLKQADIDNGLQSAGKGKVRLRNVSQEQKQRKIREEEFRRDLIMGSEALLTGRETQCRGQPLGIAVLYLIPPCRT